MTEMSQRVWGDPDKAAPVVVPSSRRTLRQPEDVAIAVLYLASPASDMVNGIELPVDGGYSAV